MTLIPESLSPRPDLLIQNSYHILPHGCPDDFHIVIYYLSDNKCKIIVRRLDCDGGWGLNLCISLQSLSSNDHDIIGIGSSSTNCVIREWNTQVQLSPIVPQQQKIPKTIVQTFASRVPQSLLHTNAIYTFLELNPDYSYEFFDNVRCRAFIQEHFSSDVLKAYDLLKPKAYKADLFRVCYIYIKGGCYFDHKFILRKPLFHIIDSNDDNVLCQDTPHDCTYNALILAIPKLPEIKIVIDTIVYHALNHIETDSCLSVTGPRLFKRKTNHLGYKLYHNHVTHQVTFHNQEFIKTKYADFSKDECYVHLFNEKKIYFTSYCKNDDYIIVAEPESWHETIVERNQNLVHQIMNTNKLRRTRERNIKNITKIHDVVHRYGDSFEFSINQNILTVHRLDNSGGWGMDLHVWIIHDKTHDSKRIRIGPSPHNHIQISI